MHIAATFSRAFIVLVLGLSAAAHAAPEKPKPAPSAEPAPKKDAEPVSSNPQMTTATFGDWVERCQRVSANGETRRICEVGLTVTAAGQSAPLAQVAIGRVKKSDPLRLTLALPVNVSFPSAPRVEIQGAEGLELSWRRCVPAGCFADVPLSAEAQRSWRDAAQAKIDSKTANGQSFSFSIPLRGLTQALEAMAKETTGE